jgi:hypothetical protein
MNTAPEILDGASVIYYAEASESFGDAGRLDGSIDKIAFLAVAKYEDADGYCLFACNESWEVVGDLLYETAEDAMKDAERFYEVSPIHWKMRTS